MSRQFQTLKTTADGCRLSREDQYRHKRITGQKVEEGLEKVSSLLTIFTMALCLYWQGHGHGSSCFLGVTFQFWRGRIGWAKGWCRVGPCFLGNLPFHFRHGSFVYFPVKSCTMNVNLALVSHRELTAWW